MYKYINIIFIIILILFIIKYINNVNHYSSNIGLIDGEKYYQELKDMNLIFKNEKGDNIDNFSDEIAEQLISLKYIKPNDKVLELGARYGTVTCITSKKVGENGIVISVEPDSDVWNALENNLINNRCNANIIKGFISNNPVELNKNGYSSYGIESKNSTLPNYTINEIKEKYKINNFNVLIADCEGCLEKFVRENEDMVKKLEIITYESDQPHMCDYNYLKTLLENNNFKLIETSNYQVDRLVWINKNSNRINEYL